MKGGERSAKIMYRKSDTRLCASLSYHSWKLAACVESLKSTPMETVTDAPGSRRSERGKKEKERGVSDKGTACSSYITKQGRRTAEIHPSILHSTTLWPRCKMKPVSKTRRLLTKASEQGETGGGEANRVENVQDGELYNKKMATPPPKTHIPLSFSIQ